MTRKLALALAAVVAVAGCSSDDSQDNNNNNTDPGPCGEGWILVPEGSFMMGIDENDPRFDPWNVPYGVSPKHEVQLSAYCIQKTEVSVADYRACVDAGKCAIPDQTHSNPQCNYTPELGELELHPVNCVTWQQARAYCQNWEGGDLPSEAQWEKAARGTANDDRLFPWGDESIDCTRANYDSNGEYNEDTGEGLGEGCFHQEITITWEVGYLTTSKGDSPYGVKDMVGNVSEWVLDCADPGFYIECAEGSCVDPVNLGSDSCTRTARGGGAGGGGLIVIQRGGSIGGPSDPYTGLRCEKSVPAK